MQARCEFVEIAEASCQPRNYAAVREHFFDLDHYFVDKHTARFGTCGRLPICNAQNLLFHLINPVQNILLLVERLDNNFMRGVDQVAQEVLFPDDVHIVLDIGSRRHPGDEVRKVGSPADIFEQAFVLQSLRQRHHVHRLQPVLKVGNLTEQDLMRSVIEMRAVKAFTDLCDDLLWAEQHSTEDCHFRFHTVWQDPF